MKPVTALLVSLSIGALGALAIYLFEPRPASPTAVASTPTTRAAAPELVATPGSPPVLDRTCSDSADWARDGGTSLIDAYISNQTSGNINPDTIKAQCPEYLPVWQQAQGGLAGGTSAVPGDAKPGTYETTSSDIANCYWERSKNGQIVDNRFITASTVKQRVTIKATDDTFVSRGCGSWIRVG